MTAGKRSVSERLRIICLGYIVRCPLGGMAWHHLQYVLGLTLLGHDTYFVEDSGDDHWACYDPNRQENGPDPSHGLAFIDHVFQRLGLGGRWIYHDALARRCFGTRAEALEELCASADLLLNLSGSNILRSWALRAGHRVFVDTDPVFTQLRHIDDSNRRARAAQHTSFFSFGVNIGKPDCSVPDDGFMWQPTRQPVVLDAWPVFPGAADGKLTTVMQWDNTLQGVPCEYRSQQYGRKAVSFGPYIDLPLRSSEAFEIALSGADRCAQARLRKGGWRLREAADVSRDPWTYQDYIRNSKAEFSIAKHGYVSTRSGWFSERSAAYLASGRPVIVQETGFSEWLPTGDGVMAFRTPDEATAAITQLQGNYERHCRRARDVAAGFFDARTVLGALIDAAARRRPRDGAKKDVIPDGEARTGR